MEHEKTLSFGQPLGKFYEWHSLQFEQNNIKTNFVKQDGGNITLKEMKKLDFDIQFKHGEELIAVKNNHPIQWKETGMKEEELHYLKKKSWVVIDFVHERAERLKMRLEGMELHWSRVNEKDFMLLLPAPDVKTSKFTLNDQEISIAQNIAEAWISD